VRPEILFPLFAPVTSLKGIGARFAALVERAAGPRLVDLIWSKPAGVIDRRFSPKLKDALPGQIATLTVQVDQHLVPASSRQPYRVRCSDETGQITLTFFRARGDYIEKILPLGQIRVISGKVESYGDQLQMSHPDHIAAEGEVDLAVEPIYGLTAGLSLKVMRRAVLGAVAQAPKLPEWQDPDFIARRHWPVWLDALETLHNPTTPEDLEPDRPWRERLAYDELLADQLALALVRAHNKRQPGRITNGDGALRARIVAGLPFALTSSQQRALEEVYADMAAPERMLRMLQGDVGSGKTVVALLALANAIETGAQGALMAPTEILARQHFATLERLAAPAGIRLALLTGRDKGKPRERILAGLADGTIQLVIGTHALFQEGVQFADLALAVIDEQHRFGVEQRMLLSSKGRGVDVLVMTATPIPRSLQLTSYGDLDASRLTEKPAGRQPIKTSVLPIDRLDQVVDAVGRALDNGAKVYWVCPLIEENETIDLAAAEERHAHLAERFGARAGLLHGRMKPTERDRVMEDFAKGSVDLLVATTVIEVGVDVPSATVMVIEHAERFGLAQLHQLRGRIGRGTGASTCLLLYAPPLGETGTERLKIMRETEDGFLIAEADLKLRGAGEVLGTRQSGMPEFRLADLAHDQELLAIAHDEARLVLARDPDLASPRGQSLRTLLYLFERDAAVKYLRSG
jgi:ATP-dependent DNA helicase RecG